MPQTVPALFRPQAPPTSSELTVLDLEVPLTMMECTVQATSPLYAPLAPLATCDESPQLHSVVVVMATARQTLTWTIEPGQHAVAMLNQTTARY